MSAPNWVNRTVFVGDNLPAGHAPDDHGLGGMVYSFVRSLTSLTAGGLRLSVTC